MFKGEKSGLLTFLRISKAIPDGVALFAIITNQISRRRVSELRLSYSNHKGALRGWAMSSEIDTKLQQTAHAAELLVVRLLTKLYPC